MGFYRYITNTYGKKTTTCMKNWSNINKSIARLKNRRIFLLKCRSSELLPRHIGDSVLKLKKGLEMGFDLSVGNRINGFINFTGRKILSLEIKLTCQSILKLELRMKTIMDEIKSTVSEIIFDEYKIRLNRSFHFVFNKIKACNMRKYDKLYESERKREKLFLNNEGWFINTTDINIPQDIADFLSLGPKFGIPTTNKSVKLRQFLADVENIVLEVPCEQRDVVRAKVTNSLTNYMNKSQKSSSRLCTLFRNTRTFLRTNPELYVIQADKGGCSVVMKKEEYIDKTLKLLDDNKTYTHIDRDPTTSIQNKYNAMIKLLHRKLELNDAQSKNLIIHNSLFPKLYCLPKIHKDNLPLRPIVSSVGSVTYQLSKFIARILSDTFDNRSDYNVRDTFEFVDLIRGMILPEGYVLISLDVVSLFTNIPTELIMLILEQKWELIEGHTSITKSNFLMLIRFIFGNTYFSFQKKFYLQIFGTPMGSPISPILAKIVLDYLLDMVIPRLPFEMPFIYKYVDDLICAVPESEVATTLEIFNSYNNHLQFTVALENNRSVPFLDTLVIRLDDNGLVLNWYQKPTASGRFLNYYSNHPTSQKFNLVTAMRNRILRICDERFHRDNLRKLYSIFQNNGYPKNILRKLIFTTQFYDGPTEETSIKFNFKRIPYIHDLTNSVVSIFSEFDTVRLAKYSPLRISDLFSKVKDQTPVHYMNNVIYKIPCTGCPGVYIGQTKQWLKNRMTQHRSDIRIKKLSCAASKHCVDTGHSFDFDEVKILEHESTYKCRLFLEMFHINKNGNSINFKTDTDMTSNIYCNIMKRLK